MYRAPLVFSGLSCLVGNLVLCLSYDTKLLPLLYIARLVTGVGASFIHQLRFISHLRFSRQAGRMSSNTFDLFQLRSFFREGAP